jgi:hypothetical protein
MALGDPQQPGPSLDRSLSKSGVVYSHRGFESHPLRTTAYISCLQNVKATSYLS